MGAVGIFEMNASLRTDIGKGASRRLRKLQDLVPAIMYGGVGTPIMLTLEHNKVLQALKHEAFYSHILTINVEGKKHKAILKDLQRHPVRPAILHMDFQQVSDNDILTIRIPIHYTGQETAPGVLAGGIVNHNYSDLEVRCKVSDLPEFIAIDIQHLELDQSIHLSEIKLPAGVEPHVHDKDHDVVLVSIHMPRVEVEEEPVAEALEGEAADTDAASETDTAAKTPGADSA